MISIKYNNKNEEDSEYIYSINNDEDDEDYDSYVSEDEIDSGDEEIIQKRNTIKNLFKNNNDFYKINHNENNNDDSFGIKFTELDLPNA